jgi:hypothetical protein
VYNTGVTSVYPICGRGLIRDRAGWKGTPQSLVPNVIASSGLFYTKGTEWGGGGAVATRARLYLTTE